MEEGPNSWLAAALAAVPSVCAGVWAGIKYANERSDRGTSERDKIWDRLNTAQAAWFTQQERTIAAQQKRIDDLTVDRDRGWDLARYWNGAAHRLRHLAANARQVAELTADRAGYDLHPWQPHEFVIPAFEEPEISADQQRIDMRRISDHEG